MKLKKQVVKLCYISQFECWLQDCSNDRVIPFVITVLLHSCLDLVIHHLGPFVSEDKPMHVLSHFRSVWWFLWLFMNLWVTITINVITMAKGSSCSWFLVHVAWQTACPYVEDGARLDRIPLYLDRLCFCSVWWHISATFVSLRWHIKKKTDILRHFAPTRYACRAVFFFFISARDEVERKY